MTENKYYISQTTKFRSMPFFSSNVQSINVIFRFSSFSPIIEILIGRPLYTLHAIHRILLNYKHKGSVVI